MPPPPPKWGGGQGGHENDYPTPPSFLPSFLKSKRSRPYTERGRFANLIAKLYVLVPRTYIPNILSSIYLLGISSAPFGEFSALQRKGVRN